MLWKELGVWASLYKQWVWPVKIWSWGDTGRNQCFDNLSQNAKIASQVGALEWKESDGL